MSVLPYGRQELSDADVAAVAEALGDQLITQGRRVDEFEQAVAEYVGARHAVAFANGTAALHAAAHAAGIGPGRRLLTSPISFVASANCALFTGGTPAFADIDPATYNLDVAAAAAAADVAAIVPVSLTGLPVDLTPLQAARKRGVVVIEDAAHALGAVRDGRPVGGGGDADMHVFSFHPVKSVTTGEGGVVTTERDDLADALWRFRTHGIVRGGGDDPLLGGWHYDVAELGFNYRITDFQCALGTSQMRRLDDFIERRNRVATAYRERLSGVDGLRLPPEPPAGDRHAYHLFVVRFQEGADRRREVYDRLRAEEILCQLHYIPIYRHGLYRDAGYGGLVETMPHAEAYYREALSLPMFPGMTEADVDRVVEALARAGVGR